MSEFSSLLKAARERQDLTQKELADRCKIGPVQICNYEKGRVIPKEKIQNSLETNLGLPLGYFKSKMDSNAPSWESVEKLFLSLRDLEPSPSQRALLFGVTEMVRDKIISNQPEELV